MSPAPKRSLRQAPAAAFVLATLIFALPAGAQAAPTATPISHVVIVIEENHSFDNLFGTYPFGWPPIVDNTTLSVMWPDGLYASYSQLASSRNGTLTWISLPLDPNSASAGHVHPYYAAAPSTVDPYEGGNVYQHDYEGGAQGFAYYSGTQSLAYFSYQEAGLLWDYAEEYVLADNYYAPALALTEPNRVAYLTAQPPTFDSNHAADVAPFNATIMYELSAHGVSWGYYVYGYGGGQPPWPLSAFSGAQKYQDHYHSLEDFYLALSQGGLPAVSWVMFVGGNTSEYDMHPPYNITLGAQKLVELVDAVMRSPYAQTTAIFVTFDEGGGYFDHVVPPAFQDTTLGQRIPLLVISTYAKEGWVDNYTMSGYTLVGFIDYNWRLPWLTGYAQNSDVQGLLAAFEFSAPPRQPLVLTPQNWTYPLPLQQPVHYGYIARVQAQAATTQTEEAGSTQTEGAPLAVLVVVPLLVGGLLVALTAWLRKQRNKT